MVVKSTSQCFQKIRNCEQCQDGTYTVNGERIHYQASECRAAFKRKFLLAESGLVGREHNEAFANAIIDANNKGLYAYLQHRWDKRSSIYLYGANGTGKSYTANCIAHMLIDCGVLVRVEREIDMASKIQATFSDYTGQQERDVIGKFKRTHVLIIQDIGKYGLRKNSEWWGAQLFDIIDYRNIKGLCTIYTSNYSLPELAARLGDNHGNALYSRINGDCMQFELKGNDRRAQ